MSESRRKSVPAMLTGLVMLGLAALCMSLSISFVPESVTWLWGIAVSLVIVSGYWGLLFFALGLIYWAEGK